MTSPRQVLTSYQETCYKVIYLHGGGIKSLELNEHLPVLFGGIASTGISSLWLD